MCVTVIIRSYLCEFERLRRIGRHLDFIQVGYWAFNVNQGEKKLIPLGKKKYRREGENMFRDIP